MSVDNKSNKGTYFDDIISSGDLRRRQGSTVEHLGGWFLMHQVKIEFPVLTFMHLELQVSRGVLVLLPEFFDFFPLLIQFFGHDLNLKLLLLKLSLSFRYVLEEKLGVLTGDKGAIT